MKKFIFAMVLLATLSLIASGQKIAKPTLTPKDATPEQTELIHAGIALHDAKRYDEAITMYQEVLAENPDSTLALYELALTYYAKGDIVKSMETAHRGAKYKSSELALFYGLMANSVDDIGKPEEAVKIYQDALKMLAGDATMKEHISSLHFNLGITYFRQKKYAEARAEQKLAVENNFRYASPHFILAVLFDGTKYPIPAFVAAIRSVSLELTTQRAGDAAAIIAKTLKTPDKNEKTGNTTINLSFGNPTDEGDFGLYELLMGTLMIRDEKEDKGKTDNELFAEAMDSVIGMLSEDKKIQSTFVGKNYVPFLAAMKKNGHTKAFSYLARHLSGDKDALKWLEANEDAFGSFITWAKTY